jgi:hypothetical protein
MRGKLQCEVDPTFAFTLVTCPAYLALKMEAICSSETSVDFQRTTRYHKPEDSTLYYHRCENLKSYCFIILFKSFPMFLRDLLGSIFFAVYVLITCAIQLIALCIYFCWYQNLYCHQISSRLQTITAWRWFYTRLVHCQRYGSRYYWN